VQLREIRGQNLNGGRGKKQTKQTNKQTKTILRAIKAIYLNKNQ
jgi:hypothetical protein